MVLMSMRADSLSPPTACYLSFRMSTVLGLGLCIYLQEELAHSKSDVLLKNYQYVLLGFVVKPIILEAS